MSIVGGAGTLHYLNTEKHLDPLTSEIKQAFDVCEPISNCLERVATARYAIHE